MDDLMRYLTREYMNLYSGEDPTVVIYYVYKILSWCIRDSADHLQVDSQRALWLKGGKEIGHLPMVPSPTPSFYETFLLVGERDEIVRGYFVVEAKTPEYISYKIEYPSAK